MFHVKHVALFASLILFNLNTIAQTTKEARFVIKELPNWPTIDSVILKQSTESVLINQDSMVTQLFYWTNYSRKYPKRFWDSVVNPFLNLYPQFNTSFATSLKRDLFEIQDSLPLLISNKILFNMAKEHCTDLKLMWPKITHNSLIGKSFSERVNTYGSFTCAGENISVGNANVVLQLIFLYLDEGLLDLGHRKTLLNPRFENMGISKAEPSPGVFIFVQDFSCKQ